MYSEIKEKIISSGESFLLKGSPGTGKTSLLFDCFLKKVYEGTRKNIFFLTPSLPQTYLLKEKAVSDTRFSSGYNQLNILTFNDFIKFFVRDNLLFSEQKPFVLPVDQYSSSRVLFLLDILEQIILPQPYETWKSKEKFAGNVGEVFTFLSDLSIRPDFLTKIKGYEWLFEVYNLYRTKSLDYGFYFYDILPVLSEKILKSLPEKSVMEEYSFYIDDLQEIIPSQYEFLRNFISCLNKRGVDCNFLAAYEPDYSLNSNKGAALNIVEKFISDFNVPRNNIVELKNDCLSDKSVRKLSISLKNYTEEPASDDLFDQIENDNSVKCVETSTRTDETYYIAAQINHFIKSGVMPSEIGVFIGKFDKNAVMLKTVLNSYGIPAEFECGDFIETSVIYRFFQSFFNLIENFESDDDVCILLDSPVLGIASRELGDIRKYASVLKISLFDAALRYCDKIADLKKREILRKNLFFVRNLKLEDTGVPDIFYKFAEISGLLNYAQNHDYTELNVLRRIFRATDFFVSFYSKLRNGKEPSLKDVIDSNTHFMPAKIRNTNLEQLDSVKIVSLRSKVPSKFKIVFVPNMNVQVFPNMKYDRIPLLLNEISGKIPNLKQTPFSSDKNYLLNAVNSVESKIFFLYPKDSGEPSPLYDYIKSLSYVCCESIENSFAQFDDPFFIQDTGTARIWLARRLADTEPEDNDFIMKTVNRFIPSVDIKEDIVMPELTLPVSLSEDYIFSATDLDLYLECPRKFFLQRLIRIEDDSVSENASFGQLIHSVLELFHSVYPDWRGRLSSEEIDNRKKFLFELLGRQIDRLSGFADFIKRILEFQAKNCLRNYWDVLMDDKMRIYYIEKKINFFIENIPFTSKIDRIDDGSLSGGYRIIDYKTGGKAGKSAALKNECFFDTIGSTKKSFQLPIYYFAVKKVMNINVSELCKFFLQAKDKNNQLYCLKSVLPIEPESKSKQITLSELEDVKKKIIAYTSEIQNGVYEKNKSKCFECPCEFICG